MRQPDVPKKPNITGWLWWLAFLIAAIGGLICYLIAQDPVNPDMRRNMMLVATISTIGAGVCVIAATAHWWTHR